MSHIECNSRNITVVQRVTHDYREIGPSHPGHSTPARAKAARSGAPAIRRSSDRGSRVLNASRKTGAYSPPRFSAPVLEFSLRRTGRSSTSANLFAQKVHGGEAREIGAYPKGPNATLLRGKIHVFGEPLNANCTYETKMPWRHERGQSQTRPSTQLVDNKYGGMDRAKADVYCAELNSQPLKRKGARKWPLTRV
jgi:hypothetical protein